MCWLQAKAQMSGDFEYDVAFSFLQQDEQVAVGIADRIRERVPVFIYTERQRELVANDGVDAFSQVFKKGARIVVVLFRESWGQTKWTRIEETAIKSRHLEEGPKFLVIASLDGNHPIWYPETWIWTDFGRYGIDGLASVLETKVREAGGSVHEHTVVDEAIQLRNEIAFKSGRSHWHNSHEGVLAATEELENLFLTLQQLTQDIRNKSPELRIQFRKDSQSVGKVYSKGFQLQLVWHTRFDNTLRESKLYTKIIAANNISDYVIEKGGPKILRDTRFEADLSKAGAIGWRQTSGVDRFFTSVQLADSLLRDLISEIRIGGNHGD